MVNYTAALDDVFIALSSPVRRTMLARLKEGWATVGDLAELFEISAPAITKHLRILERAGLIRRQKRGREHFLQLVAQPIQDAAEWLDLYREFWDLQMQSLAEFLDAQEETA